MRARHPAVLRDSERQPAVLTTSTASLLPTLSSPTKQRVWFSQILCYVCWYALLFAGTAAYEGEPVRIKSKDLPLHWFDMLFRRAGAMLLFLPWAARLAATRLAPAGNAHGGFDRRVDLLWPAAIYMAQTLVRTAIYFMHVAGYIFTPQRFARDNHVHPPHVMSDHILLGAAVHAGLASEAALGLLNWHMAAAAGRRIVSRFACAYAALVAMLALLVAAECYFTARYFHPPAEIVLAAVIGAAIFQAPLLLYTRWVLGSGAGAGREATAQGRPAGKRAAAGE